MRALVVATLFAAAVAPAAHAEPSSAACWGRVVDASTGEPVPGALLRVDDALDHDLFHRTVRERDALAGGLFAEVTLVPRAGTAVTLGARGDVNAVHRHHDEWIDTRMSIRSRVAPGLVLTGSAGSYHQPQSFLIELPGWTSFALDRPPQRALQIANGAEIVLPWSFALELQAFYSDMTHLSEYDAAHWPNSLEEVTSMEALFPDRDGVAYGLEVLLRRELGDRITGWITYTLSRTERDDERGRAPASTDRTHVLNLMAFADLGDRFRLGGRVHVHSGFPYTPRRSYAEMIWDGPVNSARMPALVRFDLRLDKTWRLGRGWLGAFAEIANLGFARDAIGVHYDDCSPRCPRIETAPPIVIPTLGLRGEI